MIQEVSSFVKTQWIWLLVGLVFIRLISNYFKKSLYRVPGPWVRKFSTIPRILSVWSNKSQDHEVDLHKKYGKIVRLAPNLVSISDTAEINQIYGIGTKFIKSPFYQLSSAHDEEGLIPDTFVLTDKALHTRMKRNAANAYSLNGLVQMEPWVEPVIERFLRHLEAAGDQPIDVTGPLRDFAMDAVFSITFGRDFNYIEQGDVLKMYHILETVSDYMAIFGQIPWIHKFLLARPFVARLVFGEGGGDKEMFELAISEREAAKEKRSDDGPMTFLQRLLLNQASNPSSINDREIMTHAFGNISAGSDTTSIALRSVLYHVLKYPEVHQKLYEEVRTLETPVKFAAANKLPYLNAVIQEGLRLHPSVGMILSRVVPPEGANICGIDLVAGTQIGINPWVLHRDPEVFPDPDVFRPERWLPSVTDEEHLKRMHRSFFTFGHGAHTCSGRWISFMEVTKLIPSLLLRFEMSLEKEEKFGFKSLWFTPQYGLFVKFRRRH